MCVREERGKGGGKSRRRKRGARERAVNFASLLLFSCPLECRVSLARITIAQAETERKRFISINVQLH